jgi:chromosome transmission fidelity protein 4
VCFFFFFLETIAIALADNWVAVATSKNFLRIFSATGIQLSVLSLPGPVVSLAAYDWTLAIVFHSGAAFAGTPMHFIVFFF